MKRRLTLLIAVLAPLLAGWGGCDFFQPREAAPPGSGATCPQDLPSDPDVVLRNLEKAVSCLDIGSYIRSFSDEFVFQADQADYQEFAKQGEYPYDGWNRSVEELVMGNVFAAADSGSVDFSDPRDIQESGLEKTYSDTPYVLRIVKSGSGATTYQGLATLKFKQDNSGNWSITSWEDKRSGGGADSWGRLRGEQRQR